MYLWLRERIGKISACTEQTNRIPQRKIHPLHSSLRAEVDKEIQYYLPSVLSTLVLMYIPKQEVCIRTWGKYGEGKGELSVPSGIAILSSGEIVVTEVDNHRIQVFSSEGKFLRMWGRKGREAGEFYHPHGICTLRTFSPRFSEEIFVTDMWNCRIQVFTVEGKFLRMWGRYGKWRGAFNTPRGITVLPSGEIAVADTKNHRIQVFTVKGRFLRKWGKRGIKAGEFDEPRSIIVLPSGDIAVADTNNYRIQVFTPKGKFLHMWGTFGWERGEFDVPVGITLRMPYDEIIITIGTGHIQAFTPEGKFLRMWGTKEFAFPSGLTSSPSGDIIIADTYHHCIKVYQTILN